MIHQYFIIKQQELDDLDVYNTFKNGYPWCKVFIDWSFVQAMGLDRAGQLLQGWTAGVEQFYCWYKSTGQIYYHPEKGDLVIFGDCDHIGIITDFDDDTIYTIEGNTSADVECEANGGAVAQKSYSRYSSWINCYARPSYSDEPSPVPPTPPQPTHRMLYNGCQGDDVEYVQNRLIEKGYSLPSYGADGYYGGETEDAIRQLQADAGIGVDGICGDDTRAIIDSSFVRPDRPEYPGYLIYYGQVSEDVRTIQLRLIELGYDCGYCGADGFFGADTERAVMDFQNDNGLDPDGIVGELTF